MDMLSIVVDIDDVISVHTNRDYANAVPNQDIIDKLEELHTQGFKVKLYTSRGMVSCNGDAEEAKQKNADVLIKWLRDNKVSYDEIVFGKPLGDLYVDDRCMPAEEFAGSVFCELKGGSGLPVYRLGNIVKKYCKEGKVSDIKLWYKLSKGLCNAPRLVSSLYNAIYIKYIDGDILSACLTREDVEELIKIIKRFSATYVSGKCSLEKHISTLLKNKCVGGNASDAYVNGHIDLCIKLLNEYEPLVERNASFSHGDLTLCNVVKSSDLKGSLFLLDSEFDVNSSSYLLDFAKLKMSLLGYDYRFGIVSECEHVRQVYSECLGVLNGELDNLCIRGVVDVLCYMYILRLWRYRKDSAAGKEGVAWLIERLFDDDRKVFNIAQ